MGKYLFDGRVLRGLLVLFVFATLLFWPSPGRVLAAAGDLDTTFGNGGKVTTDFFGLLNEASDIALQPDGKIIAAGYTQTFTTDDDFALVRYNTDGSLDTTFASGGTLTTDFFGGSDQVNAVALQPDGKIVVAGYTVSPSRFTDFAFARYNSDGSLDSTFGVGGKVAVSFLNTFSQATDLALQTDGKIVVGGIATTQETNSDFAVVRYEGDQSFDLCLQDENGGGVLQINSTTGDYLFSDCDGRTITGTGAVSVRGCNLSLRDTASDRRIIANVNTCANRATASIQLLSAGARFNITDRNTANNTCACR